MISLFEKHRPRAWSEVIGHEKPLKRLRIAARNGWGGRAYWLTGKSGTGKTTIARLIAAELADPVCTIEVDASDVTMDWVRNLESSMRLYGFGDKAGRAWIINESHGLRSDIVRRLLTLLEPENGVPDHVAIIFTTTIDGEEELFEGATDAHPLLSRVTEIRLTTQGLAPLFAARAREIALSEGLDGKPESAYVRLVNDCKGNMRQVLSRIDSGEMAD